MSDANPKLKLIRNLLAKAEATQFEHEADEFRSKAFELMAKYGVEEAMLNAHRPEAVREQVDVRLVEVLPGSYLNQRVHLLQQLATALGVENVHYLNSKKRRQRRTKWEMRMGVPAKPSVKNEQKTERVELVGYPSDMGRVEMLWTSLCLQMATMVGRDPEGRLWAMDRGQKRAYNNGRVAGFITEVTSRVALREVSAKQQAKQDDRSGSTALVLVDRATAIETFWKARHDPKSFSRSSSSFGTSDYDGHAAGRKAGERANIGGTGLGQTEQRALG